MKVLVVSDEVVSWIYSPRLIEKCGDVNIVVSCGDLPITYLEFIASALNRSCFYVRGNHDHFEIDEKGNIHSNPEGWMNLDMTTRQHNGITLAGLEGCNRYKPGADAQYTQGHQWLRALWLSRRFVFRRPDIFVTHAPPYGTHDGPDQAHTGFKSFNWIIETFKPRLLLHGHQHRNYAPTQAAETRVGETLVVNCHPYRILDFSQLDLTLARA
jgi:Icc-related predicted phosphoesterase